MYAGHFAAGLAMRAQAPRVPAWILLVGVGFMDLVFGVLVIAGVERVTVTPGQSPGFALDFIDWSHSLVAGACWALAFGALFWRRGRETVAWAAAAVFSHFVLDYPMHPGDLAVYPHSEAHLGAGLWARLPTGWWWLELGFVAVCLAFYAVRARREQAHPFGGRAAWVCAVVVALHAANSPWLSPTI